MINIAKQQVLQRYILKINSERLRNARWDLELPLNEARRNEELVSIADSQLLRWIDELNGMQDADVVADEVWAEIKSLRKAGTGIKDRRRLKELYNRLDELQYKPDYVCVIMQKNSDYKRARKGFKINGVAYRRLLGTNGGIKNSTIVFVSERLYPELIRRIQNGRDMTKTLVPAKLEAYQALTCSASIPVSAPSGVLVVKDSETQFKADTIYLRNDDSEDEPIMEFIKDDDIRVIDSDGNGMMLPSLAERWSKELGLDYVAAGMNTRASFEKGMLFTFDFIEFAEKVAGRYYVEDAWGDIVDIRQVEVVLTTSMLKLWDSYESCEHYLRCCEENGYTFGISKVSPKELENEHTSNYQFIQSFDLDDDDIAELIAPTMQEINDVLTGDWRKAVLFLRGKHLSPVQVAHSPADIATAIMADQRVLRDSYVVSRIYQQIKNRIDRAKVGVLNLHANYSIVSGDMYALCQSMFGMPVTGLLDAHTVYNKYWVDGESDELICFRAPMSCHENCVKVRLDRSEEARYWFRYMDTVTVINAWDTMTAALNGMDKDGDLVMLTDNPVLIRRHKELPAIVCEQKQAKKIIPTEDDIVASNMASFGDDIGKITNRVTSMYELQARFDKDSEEYKELEYRIRCGQLLQQDAIDKAKGIISKPMPKTWYDKHAARKIESAKKRDLYLRILADKKPYFMRYIYPDLARQYRKFQQIAMERALLHFGKRADEILSMRAEDMTDEELDYVHYYRVVQPVGDAPCVLNKICKIFEDSFDGGLKKFFKPGGFDPKILKSGVSYTKSQETSIRKLYDEYTDRLRTHAKWYNMIRADKNDVAMQTELMRQSFRSACAIAVPDPEALCDIMIDLCYKKSATKQFVWDMCADQIVKNLLRHGNVLQVPVPDNDGDIVFAGERFSEIEYREDDVNGTFIE